MEQAKKLDTMLSEMGLKLNRVWEFNLDDSILVERIEGRRIHTASGRSYHVKFNPPKVEGKDDITGEALIQRKDDNATVLKTRLKSYHDSTTPLLDYYRQGGLLRVLNADQAPNNVWQDLMSSLDN
mmetsp:Transcript_8520/g.9226  ORF Transcript_8520/g.9226 Transcript_8520/m.9226 type:complete len:126 (-) Transcript_8520:246-623(-)